MFNGFYKNKRVLVTGHTGFKGAWLSLWLERLGAKVTGLSLAEDVSPSLYELIPISSFAREFWCDLRQLEATQRAVAEARPDFIFHLAAQSLVRRSYREPVATFNTNVNGTIHLLEAVRQARLNCPVLVITSDKCYENTGQARSYQETDPLGGHDVYSMSKAAAELAVAAWRRSFFDTDDALGPVATARAGNVIGGGDYAPDRLIPDAVRALIASESLRLRNPGATRPWQHVLDCLSGYLWLGARLATAGKRSAFADAFNFGPGPGTDLSVAAVVGEFFKHWPGQWQDVSEGLHPYEAARLDLAINKAAEILSWKPTWSVTEAIAATAQWYRARHEGRGEDMLSYTSRQIESFGDAACGRRQAWAVAQ